MAKTAKEKNLEKQYAEAKAKQTGEIAQAQIEVYEGQTYEAKNAYVEAKSKRSKARSKLPEEIPTDPYYKERLLEAQYIKARVASPEQREEVDDYTAEIKRQQKAKETVQVLDKAMPELYASAVAESKSVEAKVSKAKVAETKRQEELVTGFQTAIITEQKAEAKRVARVAKEAKDLADERQARADKFYADGGKIGKTDSKKLHYSSLGGGWKTGDVIPVNISRAGYGGTGFDISDRYYQEAATRLGITVAQAKQVSAVGARTQSGKARDKALRAVQDPTGKLEEQYQSHRRLAKKTTASAYGSMSAVERSTSSALASEFATNPDAKKKNTLGVLHETTGGLIGKSIKDTGVAKGEPSSFKVYETNEKLYKSSNGLLGKKDVTAKVMPIIEKQREIELANRRQQQYVEELRAGNIGIATALANPQTTQQYESKSTVNLKAYLDDRKLVAHTTSDSLFSADADKRGMGVKVTGKEVTERKHAKERIDVFKAQVFNTQKIEDSNAIRFTHLPDPTVGTIGMGKPNDVLEQKGQSYFGVTPPQIAQDKMYDYTVASHAPASFTTMGGSFQAHTPVTFDTKKEADDYSKARPKERVFTEWWQHASGVDSGELPNPKETETLTDDVKYYSSVIHRPLVNLATMGYNLTQPPDKQVAIYETATERLLSGTIDDATKLDPMKGSGVKSAYDYVAEDPLRTVLEVPAEGLMWVLGGKAVQAGMRGAGVVKSGLAGAKFIPQPVKAVGTKIESGVGYVQGIPKKAGVAVGSQVWKITPAQVQAGLKSVDKSLAYVGGQRVGMGTAMNLRYTWQGRKLLKEAKDTSFEANVQPKFGEVGLFGKLTNDPVVIKSKNVIEVPIKETDESIFHLRNTQQTAQAVKVGNVQQYYKTATPNFTNVPKHGLSLPKAPKLPSLDPMRKWVRKTKKNVNLVEQKGWGAMAGMGDKVKLKAVEKGMKIKDNIPDAELFAKAEIEGRIRDAKLMALGKKYQAEKQMDDMIMAGKKKLDPLSEQAGQNNAWNKLSRVKAETKVKLNEMKKGITDRPATEELILYREATETTATKSIARSTAEPLTESYTPIKTSITHTKTPTDFTTGKIIDPMLKKFTVDGKPITKYVSKEVSLSVSPKIQPNLETVGEQVRIPFKDYKTIKSLDQANLNRMYEQGKYKVLEKDKLVEKKVEVRALQQEDVDKTLIQRNTLTGTGEKIQESSVREWGGTKKTLYGDVEVGGQRTDVILGSLSKKVLTTKLSPLPKKTPSKVIHRSMRQDDTTSQWTGGSTSGNPMTGRGTTVPEFGGKGRGKTSTPEETGTYDPRTGTVTVNKSDIISSPIKGKAKEVMKDYSTTWKSTKSPYRSAYVGGAIVDTVSGLTPKDMIKTGVDTGIRIDTGTQIKIDTKIDTGMKQDSVQKLNADTMSRIKSRSRIRSEIKLDTGLKQQQKVATAQIPLLRMSMSRQTSRPKALPIVLPKIDLEDKPAKRGKRGKKAGFIGNVRLDNIMGMYKRKEITYGKRKVTKLERQDARLTSKTPNRISMPASSLLKTKKKKKKKTEMIFGNKSKDEFGGFGLSKPKKTKRKKTTKTKRIL